MASIFTDAEEMPQEAHKFSGEVRKISRLGGWEFDVATGQVSWTGEVYSIYGVAKDYDINDVRRSISFHAPEDRPAVERAFELAVKYGTPYDLEARFVRLNGERIWVRTLGNPVLEGLHVVSVTGNIVDVTECKQVGLELRASQERFRAMVNAFDGAPASPSSAWKGFSILTLPPSSREAARPHDLSRVLQELLT